MDTAGWVAKSGCVQGGHPPAMIMTRVSTMIKMAIGQKIIKKAIHKNFHITNSSSGLAGKVTHWVCVSNDNQGSAGVYSTHPFGKIEVQTERANENNVFPSRDNAPPRRMGISSLISSRWE